MTRLLSRGGRKLGEGAAGAVENGDDEERDDRGECELLPDAGRDAEAQKEREETEEESAVALAHGAVVAAGDANLNGDDAGHFADDGEDDDEHDLERVETGDEGEGKIEGGVGHDITDFVEDGAEAGFLAVLAREHTVDGVERHADEEEGGDEEKSPAGVGLPGETSAHGDRECGGEDGDLVGGDAGVEERARKRTEEVLESGLDVVDRGHGSECGGWSELNRKVAKEAKSESGVRVEVEN